MTDTIYLDMLVTFILQHEGPMDMILQQHYTHPYSQEAVKAYLDNVFSQRRICHRAPIHGPPDSPDLMPLDFHSKDTSKMSTHLI